MSGNVCQLVLWGLQPAGQLLCCDDNSPCLANPPICSSTNKMVQCWFINTLDACKRKDNLAKTVCQYLDGVYCLKGETDESYDNTENDWNVISVILNRNTATTSVNGYTSSYPPSPKMVSRVPQVPGGNNAPSGPPPPSKSMVCSDSMASGFCQIEDSSDSGYDSFSYDVEICNNSIDIINSLPQISNATTTVTSTVLLLFLLLLDLHQP
ncbi:hypothetical protein RclHR1_01980021 [Rhizophagus clarus]|uniref:Extracellular membrane protein CFEM domain-containing protein n=1 Tax=Rhizophagus clarus TaxID=94130 RepID=A0A2Z6RIH8_9GLOM|nr:hypothetical protein RclHR1_01980021 [Rhizophagus clarus]GES92972.1 hypothetical protein GLOIN_2v1783421 [Rhizophagus clarus]